MDIEKKYLEKIVEIGRLEQCSEDEMKYFLPNFPMLRGSEWIFKIGWANATKYLRIVEGEEEFFIKGFHYVEMKYREATNNTFGFGSPSPTHKLIQALEKDNENSAKKLEQWILNNGGNYYIGRKS